MKTTRLSLLLIVVALLTGMLAVTQESATSASAIEARRYEPVALWQKYTPISVLPVPDPRNLFKGRARDRSVLWKTHLAVQLVKHPQWDHRQRQIILDAISLSTPEFFTASNTTVSHKTKADDGFESLARRAVSAFPKDQAVQLFGNVAGTADDDDLIKQYLDLSALALRKRRVVFRNLGPADKSKMWRTHLALFFVKRELTDEQEQVILSAMTLATPEHFAVRSSDTAWKTMVREPSYLLEQQILGAFPLDEAAQIFATLGDDGVSANSALALLKRINYKPLSNSGPYKQWAHSRASQQDPGMVLEQSNCSCARESDYCPIWGACGNASCNTTEDGCGTLWTYPCNGACR